MTTPENEPLELAELANAAVILATATDTKDPSYEAALEVITEALPALLAAYERDGAPVTFVPDGEPEPNVIEQKLRDVVLASRWLNAEQSFWYGEWVAGRHSPTIHQGPHFDQAALVVIRQLIPELES